MASEKFSGKVKANSPGYYKGKVIKEGEEFHFEGTIVNGKFPLWVKKPDGYKAKPSKKDKKEDSEVDDIV
jgi:hypothetical protein